jgi:cyclophilin family peptidyl-prolyl cis-trans isomerase
VARPLLALGCLVASTLLLPAVSAERAVPAAANPAWVLETVKGNVEIEFVPADAPKSVAFVLELAGRNFYKGNRIHWVQPGVVQFGDPRSRDMTKISSWGSRGSGRTVGVSEPSKKPFVRGTVGLAYREGEKPTMADGQIFILRIANPSLTGKYAMLGRVTKGMEVVDKLVMTDELKKFGPKAGQ